jgi:hypothetical protein
LKNANDYLPTLARNQSSLHTGAPTSHARIVAIRLHDVNLSALSAHNATAGPQRQRRAE